MAEGLLFADERVGVVLAEGLLFADDVLLALDFADVLDPLDDLVEPLITEESAEEMLVTEWVSFDDEILAETLLMDP